MLRWSTILSIPLPPWSLEEDPLNKPGRGFMNRRAALFLIVLASACGCSVPVGGHAPVQQLRIENAGTTDIRGLTVLFPGVSSEAQATRVDFGDIPAGKTTQYQGVPAGVYRYAAYEYVLESAPVLQPVVDWVGEKPMQGSKFTYRIKLDAARARGDQMQLIEVQTDSP